MVCIGKHSSVRNNGRYGWLNVWSVILVNGYESMIEGIWGGVHMESMKSGAACRVSVQCFSLLWLRRTSSDGTTFPQSWFPNIMRNLLSSYSHTSSLKTSYKLLHFQIINIPLWSRISVTNISVIRFDSRLGSIVSLRSGLCIVYRFKSHVLNTNGKVKFQNIITFSGYSPSSQLK